MAFLLRIVLPDRPGALGAVATALGGVHADILSVDIVERSPNGQVVDDLVVDLPSERLADSLVSAAASVAGVQVESIRPYAGRIDPHRELELLDALAARPADAAPELAEGVARIFRAGWALVLRPVAERAGVPWVAVAAASAAAPEISELAAPWWPPKPARCLDLDLDTAGSWAPAVWTTLATELAVSPLGEYALLVGRPALRWLPSELIRLAHLAGIAASVADFG